MLKIENIKVEGFNESIRGTRNSWNSWDKSDNGGLKDKELMIKLCKAGPSHAKFRRMIIAWMDITAPIYWWKEFDTYKVGTVANSCSTMHTICDKEFELDDFSFKYLDDLYCENVIKDLNNLRDLYLKKKDKKYWYSIIEFLPESYNQRRTVMLNYEVLSNIYNQRKNHKLDEWKGFCDFILELLPYSYLITTEED